jgi:hypothetical protein
LTTHQAGLLATIAQQVFDIGEGVTVRQVQHY